jgi:hypothetical protein
MKLRSFTINCNNLRYILLYFAGFILIIAGISYNSDSGLIDKYEVFLYV